MQIENEIIGQFIDASVDDHVEAKRLLNANPGLRNATWFGDDLVLNFLTIENFVDGVRFCLQNGFDPNQTNCNLGMTALHYACKLNYFDVATELLQNGADPNAESIVDATPIQCCIKSGNATMLDLLISSGANARHTTEFGETVFDNWPNDADKQSALAAILAKHNIHRDGETTN